MNTPFNVLFICSGNSARSIIAEALANSLGHGRLRAFSAGSQPMGVVHPMALAALEDAGLPTAGLRSKSWDEFSGPDAPHMDLVITVCDRAAQESCPTWPGHPLTARWSVEDPAAAPGNAQEQRRAFGHAMHVLQQRISLLLALRTEALERLSHIDSSERDALGITS